MNVSLNKEVDTDKDIAKYTLVVEVDRKSNYQGIDVFPDKLLYDLLLQAIQRVKLELVDKLP